MCSEVPPFLCGVCCDLQGNSSSVPTSLVLFSGPAWGGREPVGQSGTGGSPESPRYPGIPLNCAPCCPEGHIQMQWEQRTREAQWVSVLLREEELLLLIQLIRLLVSTGGHCWSAHIRQCSQAQTHTWHYTTLYTLQSLKSKWHFYNAFFYERLLPDW